MNSPHILILGGNFAGLGAAQAIRRYAGPGPRITLVDRKSYLLYVPNIPADVFADRDPTLHERMDLPEILAADGIGFVQGEVTAVEPDLKRVEYVPAERPGTAGQHLDYDYLVVALGNRLAYDRIEGYADYGDTVSDLFQGNRLRQKLHGRANGSGYKGGPIAVGSARFNQGNGAEGLEPYPGGKIPTAVAACEGPPLEVMLSAATWLQQHGMGGPEQITVFTPAEVIAEDAGEKVVEQMLGVATEMGFGYRNNTRDIRRITADGVELENGDSIEAELKIVFPDWVAHDFLHGLPICDDRGFVVTDLLMRNPKFPEVFAAGDCAAATVPKLGSIGHQQTDIVGRQIARDLGALGEAQADAPLAPEVLCIGDMGNNQGFYIRSNSWYGGDTQVLKLGHVPFFLKMQYKELYFARKGKMPDWGLAMSELLAERVFA